MAPQRKVVSILVLLAVLLIAASGPAAAAQLLVSDPGANAVLSYDIQTKAFGGVFASGGGLIEPSGLTFGPDGNLYLVSLSNGAVYQIFRR